MYLQESQVLYAHGMAWFAAMEWGTCKRERGMRTRIRGSSEADVVSRYANTDFVVLYTLQGQSFTRLVLSYDICCQWSRNLKDRIAAFPESMRLDSDTFDRITFVIPKFHLYGHGSNCQTTYSLNYLPHSAETNGSTLR